MAETQSTPDGEEPTAYDLTAFQQNILTVLAEEPQYGLAIKRELESYYDSEVNHGRLYPNSTISSNEDSWRKANVISA